MHWPRVASGAGRERLPEPERAWLSPLMALTVFALAGAIAFIAAHVVIGLAAGELGFPPDEESPWFLTNSRSRAMTQAFAAVVTAATGLARAIPQWLRLAGGFASLLGSVTAMSGVLLLGELRELWPLMLLAGVLYLAVATAAGLVPAMIIGHVTDARRRAPGSKRG